MLMERGGITPLTRFKYGFLIAPCPSSHHRPGSLQFAYFYNLDANIITSCCSRLFTPETSGVEASLSSLSPALSLGVLYGGFCLVADIWIDCLAYSEIWIGLCTIVRLAFFIGAIIAIISVVAPYIYAQPYHHCPFCILKAEYDFIGYALYLTLFLGTAMGIASGFLSLPIRALQMGSLAPLLPRSIRVCLGWSLGGFAAFVALCALAIWSSRLVMMG